MDGADISGFQFDLKGALLEMDVNVVQGAKRAPSASLGLHFPQTLCPTRRRERPGPSSRVSMAVIIHEKNPNEDIV
jgi:hypothetical protein